MTLETIYFITQIIAVVLILPTLVFLSIQGRQTENQIKQSNVIARLDISKRSVTEFSEFWFSFYTTNENAAFMRKAIYSTEPLSDVEQEVFASRMEGLVAHGRAGYELLQEGLMTEATYFGGERVIQALVSWPRPRRIIERLTAFQPMDHPFRREMARILTGTPLGSIPAWIDVYNMNDFSAGEGADALKPNQGAAP